LPGGNRRDSGIAGWENMGMGFKFQMGMGMKSLKWEGIGTKNLFPHTSSLQLVSYCTMILQAVAVATQEDILHTMQSPLVIYMF